MMSLTDVLSDTPDAAALRGSQQVASHAGDVGDDSRRRWWKRGLLALGVVAGLAGGVALVAGAMSPADVGPQLTHTITRGDLVVSVIEQGTLESSSNTEITCKVRGWNTVTWVIPGGSFVEKDQVLVRLDTRVVEEAHSLTETNTHIATATLARSTADVTRATVAKNAYLSGRYRSQMTALQNQLKVAERNLRVAQTMLGHSKSLFEQGYVTELEVEGSEFTVQQAELERNVKVTEIEVLEKYTKEMELKTLEGDLRASQTKNEADVAGLKMEKTRRKRAADDVANCVIKAPRAGLVIYPSAAAWKDTPDVDQGATVRKDQKLLLMPDLTKMQVKVGIHETIVDRIKPKLTAKVSLPEMALDAEVSSVASVATPAGWWNGNVVKYDTIIKLPSVKGLKPGMSAEVEVIIARHEDVLTIPVAAVVETERGTFCWVQTDGGPQRRSLQLGDTNDVFFVVASGLKEGDQVVLNPLAHVKEAQAEAAKTLDEIKQRRPDSSKSDKQPSPPGPIPESN